MKKLKMMMVAALAVLASCGSTKSGESALVPLDSKVIVAYVTYGVMYYRIPGT